MTDDLGLWRSAAYRHARERDHYAALLAEASEALRAVGKAAITVESTLKQPYPDAPDTSPWSRWMEAPARRAYNLGHQIRRELNAAPKESITDDPVGPEDTPELTAEDAVEAMQDMATDLYKAEDRLAFIAEMCDAADRAGEPVTTERVRSWLQYNGCGGVLRLPDDVMKLLREYVADKRVAGPATRAGES